MRNKDNSKRVSPQDTELREKLVSLNRVAKVTKGGRTFSFSAIVVVGDGEAREDVARIFAPLQSRVSMLGLLGRDDIYSILTAGDIYVWPAVNEAYGMALLEAQACGLPVVAADVGGIPLIVEHGETGLLAERNDVETFGDHVSTLLRQPALVEKMGERARQKCRRQHGLHTVSGQLRDLFESLMVVR